MMTLSGLLLAANIILNPTDSAAVQPLIEPVKVPETICEPLQFDQELAPPGALVDINEGCTNDGCTTVT